MSFFKQNRLRLFLVVLVNFWKIALFYFTLKCHMHGIYRLLYIKLKLIKLDTLITVNIYTFSVFNIYIWAWKGNTRSLYWVYFGSCFLYVFLNICIVLHIIYNNLWQWHYRFFGVKCLNYVIYLGHFVNWKWIVTGKPVYSDICLQWSLSTVTYLKSSQDMFLLFETV